MLVGIVCLSVSAPAGAEVLMHRERVLDTLTRPVIHSTAEEWADLGEMRLTNQYLVELLYDKELRHIYRVRAIEALAFFRSKRSKQVLWQLVYDRHRPDVDRKMALRSLGAAWQKEVLFDLNGFLDHSSPVLREGAAMGIGLIDDPRVLSILESRLHREKTIKVRLAIERAMKQARATAAERARKRREDLLVRTPRTLPPDIEERLKEGAAK